MVREVCVGGGGVRVRAGVVVLVCVRGGVVCVMASDFESAHGDGGDGDGDGRWW